MCRMTNKNNFTTLVYKKTMRNALESEFFISIALSISYMIMLYCCPSLVLNVTLNFFMGLINGETNYPDLITPFLFIILKHFLAMSHWCLCRWAPGGPEKDKNDFTWFMFYGRLTTIEITSVYNISHSVTDPMFSLEIDNCISNSFQSLCELVL